MSNPVWTKLDAYEHLVASGMTFRVYRTQSCGSNDPAYAYLELLTCHGWTQLSKAYLGDSYYGYNKDADQQVPRLKRYAEGLVGIGATISACPPEANAKSAKTS